MSAHKVETEDKLLRCVAYLEAADGLLITAGAGMGVDSGLPDFRGGQGFWRAYPALGNARIAFEEIANPAAFLSNPRLAWGFYGHRLNLYRQTMPHQGFEILRSWAEEMPYGAFVFTSNVDGQFQRAGFPESRVCEAHGSIHHLQCMERCNERIWSAASFRPEIDDVSCLIQSEMPHCPHCGSLARPNILMFGDWNWLSERKRIQALAMSNWLNSVKNPLVVEVGAGLSIPTVRHFGEHVNAPMIRINLRESQTERDGDIGFALGGFEALKLIDDRFRSPNGA
jgi:NAD-dependent SIR2 family protein deacetylase